MKSEKRSGNTPVANAVRLFALPILVAAAQSSALAIGHNYSLSEINQGGVQILRMSERASGKVIWSEKVKDHCCETWSPNDRGVCMSVMTPANEPSILVWTEGHLQTVLPYDDDYIVGPMIWSPDGKRILFRTGRSGDGDVDLGVLCCLNLQAHKISTFQPKCEVRKMHWVGRRVLYWTGSVSPSKVIVDKRPHGWSPP